MDEAGVSLAYARSLAQGWGMVPQTGQPKVEAFVNPLWIFLYVFPIRIKVFYLYATPKIMAALLTLGTYYVLGDILKRQFRMSPIGILLVLGLLSSNPYWVRWLNSGMENPLYIFLVVIQVALLMKLYKSRKGWLVFVAGNLAGLLVLTRPDGLLLAGLFPLGLLFLRDRFNQKIDYLAVWGLGWVLSAGVYQGFRRFYFDLLWPTPFAVHQALDIRWVLDLHKWHQLYAVVLGPLGSTFLLILLLGIIWLWWRRQIDAPLLIFLLHLGGATLVFLLMPSGPLYGYRFASPFILLLYPVSAIVFRRLKEEPRLKAWPSQIRHGLKYGAALMILLLPLWHYGGHLMEKGEKVDYIALGELNTKGIQQLTTDSLKSVVVPCVGGLLWEDVLEVHEHRGLLDTALAVPLAMGDTVSYRTYLVQGLSPDLLILPQTWLEQVGLRADSSFQHNYEERELSSPFVKDNWKVFERIDRSP